jgi:acetyltransferase-like isoleucine patch superfamily enzyme
MKLREVYKRIYEKILEQSNSKRRINYLRRKGVRIGRNCVINTLAFSTEPYLVEMGNEVSIGWGTQFITHEGSVKCLGEELDGYLYGEIKIGNKVFIGINCIILLNTSIGDNCIIGAGSIVRGHFPDNSVILGNPAKVVLNMGIQKMLYRHSPGFVKMNNPTIAEKDKLVKKHFGIK